MTLNTQSSKRQPRNKIVLCQKPLVTSRAQGTPVSFPGPKTRRATGDSKKPVGVIVSVNVVCVLKQAGRVPATLYKVLHRRL